MATLREAGSALAQIWRDATGSVSSAILDTDLTPLVPILGMVLVAVAALALMLKAVRAVSEFVGEAKQNPVMLWTVVSDLSALIIVAVGILAALLLTVHVGGSAGLGAIGGTALIIFALAKRGRTFKS